MEYTTLSNGVQMPMLGYGVYQVSREDCERCVLDALAAGYRSIDTISCVISSTRIRTQITFFGMGIVFKLNV